MIHKGFSRCREIRDSYTCAFARPTDFKSDATGLLPRSLLESLLLKNRLLPAAQSLLHAARHVLEHHPRRVVSVLSSILLLGGGGAYAVATAVVSMGPDVVDLPVHQRIETVTPLPLPVAQADTVDMLRLYRTDQTRSSDTADTLLKRLGIADAEAASFLRADTIVQQNLLGRTGRFVTAEADDRHALLKLVARWSPDDNGQFQRLVIEKSGKNFRSSLETAPLSASTRLASGTIQSSLFAATDSVGIPDAIASQVAEIFSGEIDFHRALRKGDRFSVVYETLEGDGEPLRSGRVLSAEFVNAGKTYQAMWFEEPSANRKSSATGQTAQAKGAYYTLDGKSLRRTFLASPMAFSRITSGFKMRFHPILQKWRAHLGVDYAAPTGTPVRTVGDGVVDFAGVQNGFGNVVIIRHGGSHSTVYAHLSRIGVKRGQSVSQGQNIGAVGATGWATGPHLHFEFRVNGQHRDPLTIARQSETIPVSAAAKPQFERAVAMVRQQLVAAASVLGSSAQ